MNAKLLSNEYVVKKGGVDLQVYRRRMETTGRISLPVLFLVHGSSFGALAGYDLQVPGKAGYSMMDECAGFGFDVWTMDHEGYGRSTKTSSFSDISSGSDDLALAAKLVERETGIKKAAYYGQSSGSLRAALFAERHPEMVDRLALDATVWTGEGSPTLAERRKKLPEFSAKNRRPIDRAFVHSIFNRDHPGTAEERVIDAFADAIVKLDDSVPTGTYVDMCSKLPVNNPDNIKVPTLIMRGQWDGIAGFDDLIEFFKRLPNPDKHFAVMPGISHASFQQKNYMLVYHILLGFFAQPAPVYRG